MPQCCRARDRRRSVRRSDGSREVGRSRRVRHACTCGTGSTRVPSGDGSSRHWGADHGTLWQSEESGVRCHCVPQTTSQQSCKGRTGPSTATVRVRRMRPKRPSPALGGRIDVSRRSIGTSPSMHNATVARQRRGPTALIRNPGVASWHAELGLASQTHCASSGGDEATASPRHRKGNRPSNTMALR
jgi:hypothetical protein